nr:HNH endonuclease [Actinomycetales bacterium]
MGASSLPLDVGRARRYFTRTQVLGLWERDGGCASCGQTTFLEAHHNQWWDRDHGPTDLTNGVLLCSRCHHRVHADHWEIHTDPVSHAVAFIPPAHIDPDRTPRPGVHRHHPREHHREHPRHNQTTESPDAA